ncbi:DUF7344 domain-containing protein [Natronomonas sp.]|uniref:DUF7344 domain-containing protein n=1 Tax=Natronomonas sp. TaxID=2184060 RepID=UPI002FC36C99
MTEHKQAVPVDAVVSAVADEHRRAVLRLLNHTDGNTMELDALSDRVAEHVANPDGSGADHRRRIRIALHQIHLPKLADYGMVRYDRETKEARSVTDELSEELLAVLGAHESGG